MIKHLIKSKHFSYKDLFHVSQDNTFPIIQRETNSSVKEEWKMQTKSILNMIIINGNDAPRSSLMDSIVSLKVKKAKGKGVGARSLACSSTSEVEGHVGASRWGLGRLTSNSIIYMDLYKTKPQVG
jgi:hypothetical protein